MKIFSLISLLILGFTMGIQAQEPVFSRQDSLRGSITPERAWWDLTYYHLQIRVFPEQKKLVGSNLIQYKVLDPGQRLQVDLQSPLKITAVYQKGKPLKVEQEGNAWFVTLKQKQTVGSIQSIAVHYEGQPQVSQRPPWEGGLTWTKDQDGKDWIVTTCQGDGASLWWPNKDHMYDEPDSMLMSIRVPDHLMDVSNGRLRKVESHNDATKTYHWFVANPINNYGVNLNIGNYVHFSEVYPGEQGPLDCDYYVLPYNLAKAKTQFKEVPRMLQAFEHWFGPYPFYEDGFKLVDVPYPGMEHQSSVTYGNGYQNGYGGRDVSKTGWGMEFDFIIVHESGHEWFANNITYKDIADMWIHESFTAYSEGLFVDYHFGKAAAAAYTRGTRTNIQHDAPIVGVYDVNRRGSGDMYPKGANMLHTLRQWIDDDEKWRDILRGLNETFYHQTVTSAQIEAYISEQTGFEMEGFFDQYLRDVRLPIFEYFQVDRTLYYRWANVVQNFKMPLKVRINGQEHWLAPKRNWQKLALPETFGNFEVDPNFYVVPFHIRG